MQAYEALAHQEAQARKMVALQQAELAKTFQGAIGQAMQQASREDAEVRREQCRAQLRQAVDTGHFGP
jgi:hypothetical protein